MQDAFLTFVEDFGAPRADPAFDAAVMTLARCEAFRDRATLVLRRCLHGECWFHRGNAAVSLAMLGESSRSTVFDIGRLILDRAGCMDWSVRSSAFEAIIILGGNAKPLVPLLKRFSKGISIADQYAGCDGELLAGAFKAICAADPDVIRILFGMIRKGGWRVPWHAIFALEALSGKASSDGWADDAMHAIADFAVGEDATEYLDQWADLLQITMLEIGGAEHPEFRRVSAYLRSVEWLDQGRHIKPFSNLVAKTS